MFFFFFYHIICSRLHLILLKFNTGLHTLWRYDGYFWKQIFTDEMLEKKKRNPARYCREHHILFLYIFLPFCRTSLKKKKTDVHRKYSRENTKIIISKIRFQISRDVSVLLCRCTGSTPYSFSLFENVCIHLITVTRSRLSRAVIDCLRTRFKKNLYF